MARHMLRAVAWPSSCVPGAVEVLPTRLGVGLPKAMDYWNDVSEQLENLGKNEPPSKEPPRPNMNSTQVPGRPCTARARLRGPSTDSGCEGRSWDSCVR